MVIPSNTPSDTPTHTPTFTATFTPTATNTATNTATSTSTNTATATLTFTPRATETFTLTPTPSDTPTSTATDTPTITNTPAVPQIIAFTANATSVAAGASIILTWIAEADTARIERLNTQGAVVELIGTVTPTGSLPVTVPGGQGGQVIYRLVAARGGQEVSRSLPITVSCPVAWFFGSITLPPNAGCPVAGATVAAGAYQSFQTGVMFYLTSTNKVYAVQFQNNVYSATINAWDGATNYTFPGVPGCDDAPPGGLFPPQGVFDWLYCGSGTLAPIGTWFSAFGWATTNPDLSARTLQVSDTGAFFINDPANGVYYFSGGDNGTWVKVQ